MNKSELIEAITAQTDLSKAAAGRTLNAAIGAITDSLKEGKSYCPAEIYIT
jgi:DNA-binding protein HU-beta